MNIEVIVRNWRFWIAIAILVGVFGCSAVIVFGTALGDQARQPTREALAAMTPFREICGGGAGQSSARGLAAGPGPHQIVLFRTLIASAQDLTSYYNRTEDYPIEWRATTPADVELVACVHAETVAIETCEYTLESGVGAVLQRYQWVSRVVLHDARSGAVIDEGVIEGSRPRECRDSESFAGSLTTQVVTGEQPSVEAIAEWLTPRVTR